MRERERQRERHRERAGKQHVQDLGWSKAHKCTAPATGSEVRAHALALALAHTHKLSLSRHITVRWLISRECGAWSKVAHRLKTVHLRALESDLQMQRRSAQKLWLTKLRKKNIILNTMLGRTLSLSNKFWPLYLTFYMKTILMS